MDEKVEILLGSTKNIHSVDVDTYEKLELANKTSQIMEYDMKNALSATEIFDAERDANPIYRIYGRIEYLSLLNGLKSNYTKLQDFFLPASGKTIFNSFDFYLLRAASSGYTQILGSTIEYVRRFEVIATPADFELYNAGFTNNVYGDQVYAFNFNKDFDITTYVDRFNFPATELFLYAQYKLGTNGYNQLETMSGTTWGTDGIERKILFSPTTLITGNTVYGDLIEYSKSLFFQSQLSPQTYYISTPYKDDLNINRNLQWKYNPFIPFQLRYFNDSLNQANTGTTSYAQASSIPYYATLLSGGTGNYVWKDILLQGYVDPITNLGVDYPFVNKKRYLFSTIVLDVSPNLNDPYTLQVFSEIKFGTPTNLNTRPISELSNIGKPCQ
jgi:hypothetical protein